MSPENSHELQESLYVKMISNIGDVIVIIDKEGMNRYKSPNIEKHFGWKANELIGKPTWNLLHPDDLDMAQGIFIDLMEEPEKQCLFECRYLCKNGQYRWIEFNAINLINDPQIQGILGNYHDISPRKEAEQSLKESEERFKALHNASFGGIFIHVEGIIQDCNQGLSIMTGYSQQELIGMNGLLLATKDSREIIKNKIKSDFKQTYLIEGLKKDGTIFPVRVNAKNIPYKNATARVAEFRDISESVRQEKEKKHLQEQLQQAQRLESIGRLAGGVAHDFNNMLAIIFGFTELALDSVTKDSKIQRYLKEVLNAADRSMQVTRQLLAFARRQTTVPTLLNMNETIENMLNMLYRLIGEGIELKWEPAKHLWSVKMDPSQIDQILVNLCINARDAIRGLGIIQIRVENKALKKALEYNGEILSPGNYVLIQFTDTGVGITDEIKENLFEPFFTTKDKDKGTGLGLATVYGIVKQNRGMITVDSTPGEGTTFDIYLPAILESGDEEFHINENSHHSHKNQGTILLVEDESGMLTMTEMLLKDLGYQVISTSSPKEAVIIAADMPELDLLLTDVIMPGMSGKEMAERILDQREELKVLYMSGYTADIISNHGILNEGVHFIQKPFTSKGLAESILEILDS